MKKTLIALSILGAIGFTSANYTMKFPLEQAQGGSIPNGSIKFSNQSNSTDPELTPEQSLNIWEEFADSRSLPKNWNNLEWHMKLLTEIPTAPYPLTDVAGNIQLNNQQLNNIDGLRNLRSVGGTLNIRANKLTNVDALSNLTSVSSILDLRDNLITNVDGLINLTSVNILQIHINPLINLNGLSNLKVNQTIIIDHIYSGPKLGANTRFCIENANSIFLSGYAQKSQICESP